jgi:hypothetical protein
MPHGADVNELACFLHHPMACSWQTWVQCFLTGAALSCHAAVVGGAFPGGAKPLGLDIYHGVDLASTSKTEPYMEKLAFTWVCLSIVRLIMAIMHVPLMELLCHATMGQVSALEYLLSGECGCLCSFPIVAGIKCRHFSRS